MAQHKSDGNAFSGKTGNVDNYRKKPANAGGSRTVFRSKPIGAIQSRPERNTSSSSDKICIVCYKDVNYHSVGICEHSVCYECSSRMRVLMEQNECPICRKIQDHVIFTHGMRTYADVKDKIRMFVFLPKYGIYLEDEVIKGAFDALLEHKCPLCTDEPCFENFQGLREHIQRKHELFSCDLCVENIKHFSKERKFYTRADLGYHKRKGDRNDTSHRGHPLCKFCDKRFFDNDELFKHLRKDHYFCHFCDADGLNQYYNIYDDLRIHYRKEHFLCEEEQCAEEKFTSVFRTEIDLKAHLASIHSRLLGKHGTRQARILEIEFTMPKRPENERGRFGRPFGGGGRSRDTRGREGDSSTDQVTDAADFGIHQMPTVKPNVDSDKEFPTLGGNGIASSDASGPSVKGVPTSNGSAGSSSIAQKLAYSAGMNVPHWNAKTKREEDFPVLGDAYGSQQSNQHLAPKTLMSKIAGNPANSFVSRKANGPPSSMEDEFPTLKSQRPNNNVGNLKTWSSLGAKAKPDLKAGKVAPCPVLDNIPPPNDDFNLVPLSMSSRSSKLSGAQKESVVDLIPEDTEKVKTKSGNSKKKGHENPVALAATALFNGGPLPGKTKPKNPNPSSRSDPVEDFPSLPVPSTTQPTITPKKKPQKTLPQARKISPPPGFQLRNRGDDAEVASPSEPQIPIEKSKPPPGFEKFQNQSSSNISGNAFVDSIFQLDQVSLPKNSNSYSLYTQPKDMNLRTERLMEAVRGSVGSYKESMDGFLNLSTLFRRNEIPASEYYELCQNMLGITDFRKIFAELVVLLPDIEKQQELLVAHRKIDGKGELLSTCHMCHQVLRGGDVSFHMKSHLEEDSFPSLSTASNGRTNNKR